MSRDSAALGVALAALLTGCNSMSLSGVGGESSFACAAPPGVTCMSVSGLYANSQKNNLPALRKATLEDAQAPGGQAKQATAAASVNGEQPATTGPSATTERPVAYAAASRDSGGGKMSPAAMEALSSGQPIRSAPRVLRVWMAPFEDADGYLHDQRYLYVTVHNGQWLIEANQAYIQRQFQPVFQLGRSNASDDGDGATARTSAPTGGRSEVVPQRPPLGAPTAGSATTGVE